MSKKVAIMEGDKSRRFNKVDYLSTRKQGGGHVDWVPEDDRETTTKSITKNGTYKISDEKKTGGGKYYGYSEVTVNVPNSGKAIGKKPDGNTHVVQPDANGDLTDKIIPDYIKIISEPYKTEYTDGETISMSGMVVKAYQGDGSIWEASGYSSGIIPHSELTLKPPTAQASGSSDIYEKDGVRAMAFRCSVPVDGYYWRNYRSASPNGYMPRGSMGRHYAFLTTNTDTEIIFVTKYNAGYGDRFYAASSLGNGSTSVIAYEDASGAYGNESMGSTSTPYVFGAGPYDYRQFSYYDIPTSSINPEGFDFSGANSEDQTIVVSWHRPDDLKELTDTFNITVIGS